MSINKCLLFQGSPDMTIKLAQCRNEGILNFGVEEHVEQQKNLQAFWPLKLPHPPSSNIQLHFHQGYHLLQLSFCSIYS